MGKPAIEELLSIRAKVGQHIRYWRKQRKLSLQAIAAEIGYSAQAVSQIERGLIDVPTSRLVDIAAALKVAPGEFFGDPLPTHRAVPITSPTILRLVVTAEKLPPSWQQFLMTMAENIFDRLPAQEPLDEKVDRVGDPAPAI
jgi:transcriptional regulator with XRE-family HTH domain